MTRTLQAALAALAITAGSAYGFEPLTIADQGSFAVGGTAVDLTDGSRQWIEDCQVCCRPMQITISVDEHGEPADPGDVRGLHHDLAAERRGLLRCGVDVGRGRVAEP